MVLLWSYADLGTTMDGLEVVPTPGLQGVEKCLYLLANYQPSSPPDRYQP